MMIRGTGLCLLALCAAASTFRPHRACLRLEVSTLRCARQQPRRPFPCMHAQRCLIEQRTAHASYFDLADTVTTPIIATILQTGCQHEAHTLADALSIDLALLAARICSRDDMGSLPSCAARGSVNVSGHTGLACDSTHLL